jgi:type I restriction enzyme S subunit
VSNQGPRWAQELAASFPPGWEMTTIGELGELISGSTPPRANHERYFDGEIPWVKTGDLTNTDVVDTEEYLTNSAVKECRCTIHPPGSVLVAMYGGFKQIGRTGLLRVSAATNQAITAIRLAEDSPVSSEFLQAWLNHMKRAWRRIAGSSRKDPNITKSNIEAFPVPIPPPTISTAVDSAAVNFDLAGEQLDMMLNAKRTFKRGLMQQLLTGKKRFPEFIEQPWIHQPLGDFFIEKTIINKAKTIDLVYSCTKVAGIVPQAERFGKRLASADLGRYKIVEPGDLVYDPMLLWDGSIGFVPRTGTGVVSPAYETFSIRSEGNREYFWELLKSYTLVERYKQISQGTNVRRRKAHPKDFLKIVVPMPPTKAEQDRIADVFAAAQREIDLLKALREQIDLQKRGLLSKLLSGRIPVSE